MDDDDLVDVNLMNLDLNQEPTDPPPLDRIPRHDARLIEFETANRIEERIRQLEAVTARARQRQRWRQARNFMEIRDLPGELMIDLNENGSQNDGVIVERGSERGKGCKRDSSHLVAKALEVDSMVKKEEREGGSFYDCNICLDVARDPVLTRCGHLFCWPCFYQVSEIDSTSKECPVCKGEVSDSTVIPIYGNGDDGNPVCETESGLKIPPRPKACRVESIRQQHVAQGLSHVPVAEALRRIRISIGAIGNQQEGSGGVVNLEAFEGQNAELGGGGPRFRINQVSRVLSESVASLSSLSFALSNAERLVEDLETVINNRLLRNASRVESNSQVPDIDTVLPVPASSWSHTMDASTSSINQLTRASNGTNLPALSSIRRRSLASRIRDLDNRDARETRRRRLN